MKARPLSLIFVWSAAVSCALLTSSLTWAQNTTVMLGVDEPYIKQVLATEVTLEIVDAPLNEAVAMIGEQLKIELRLELRALEDEGIAVDTPVSLQAKSTPLGEALEAMLEPLDLTWRPRQRTLYVTSHYGAEMNLLTRIYPVMDLASTQFEDRVIVDAAPLIRVIQYTVEPDTWDVHGGPASMELAEGAGALVCSQTWQTHQAVQELLDALRQVRAAQNVDWSKVETIRRGKRRFRGELGDFGGGGLFRADEAVPR